MIYLILGLLLIGARMLPQWWARSVLRRHDQPRPDFPGTGGEFAEHLLRRFDLPVTVERIEAGDHYDPASRCVRLSAGVFDGRSLTAVTVAAHEVGHAIQHASNYAPLATRTRLVGVANKLERLGSILMLVIPVVLLVVRVPAAGFVTLLAGLGAIGSAALVHLVTLPVEFNASFARAMPILASGYVEERDLPAARRILLACALTYVASSLGSLLNLWRWLKMLRH